MQYFETEFHTLTDRLSSLGSDGLSADRLYAKLDELPVTAPPFLRALLVADGTVTMLLEAYFRETVRVRTLAQQTFALRRELPALSLACGARVFFRKVELSGTDSGQVYACAHTLLNPAVIKPDLFDQLVSENVGIGWILRNSARGSFREVLQISADDINELSDAISRTYVVSLEGIRALLITEEFPLHVYRGPHDVPCGAR